MSIVVKVIQDETNFSNAVPEFMELLTYTPPADVLNLDYEKAEHATILQLAVRNFSYLIPQFMPLTFEEWASNIQQSSKSPQAQEVAKNLIAISKKYSPVS